MIMEVTYLCRILFIRSKSLDTAHTKEAVTIRRPRSWENTLAAAYHT